MFYLFKSWHFSVGPSALLKQIFFSDAEQAPKLKYYYAFLVILILFMSL